MRKKDKKTENKEIKRKKRKKRNFFWFFCFHFYLKKWEKKRKAKEKATEKQKHKKLEERNNLWIQIRSYSCFWWIWIPFHGSFRKSKQFVNISVWSLWNRWRFCFKRCHVLNHFILTICVFTLFPLWKIRSEVGVDQTL